MAEAISPLMQGAIPVCCLTSSWCSAVLLHVGTGGI